MTALGLPFKYRASFFTLSSSSLPAYRVGARVAVLLGEPEVDDVDLVAAFCEAHHEVVRLDVAVQEALRVNVPVCFLIKKWFEAVAREPCAVEA